MDAALIGLLHALVGLLFITYLSVKVLLFGWCFIFCVTVPVWMRYWHPLWNITHKHVIWDRSIVLQVNFSRAILKVYISGECMLIIGYRLVNVIKRKTRPYVYGILVRNQYKLKHDVPLKWPMENLTSANTWFVVDSYLGLVVLCSHTQSFRLLHRLLNL